MHRFFQSLCACLLFSTVANAQIPTSASPTPIGSAPLVSPQAPASSSPSTNFINEFGKGIFDQAYCAMVKKMSGVVVSNPELSKQACVEAAKLKYDNCLAQNGGEDPVKYVGNPARPLRVCISQYNFELDVCDCAVDIAQALIDACDEDKLTFFGPGLYSEEGDSNESPLGTNELGMIP